MRDAARYRITANGSPDEPFGNLTITVTPLEHLANAPRGRYVLSGTAVFAHRGEQWAERITSGNSVSDTLTRRPGRAGRYLCAAWATPALHLAVRHLDAHGNPVGAAQRINVDLSGTSARRDAHLRHAITGDPLHPTARHQHDRRGGPGLR